MAIVGIGLDVAHVGRLKRALERPGSGERLRERVFTAAERAYCEQRQRSRYESYAARFAAKEAAMKALGVGWAKGVRFRDIEVVPADGAPPQLRLRGRARAIAAALGVQRLFLTLSHAADYAVAQVVAEGSPEQAHSSRARRGAAAGKRRAATARKATAHGPKTKPSKVQRRAR